MLGEDSYEYPICAMLNNVERIEHISIYNESAVYEDMDYVPECVLVSGGAVDIGKQDTIEVHGAVYEKGICYDDIAVYVKSF